MRSGIHDRQRTVSPRRRKDVQYKRLGSPQATWTSQGNARIAASQAACAIAVLTTRPS